VTLHEASDVAPSWSPDGTKLLYYTNRNGSADIYSVSIETGQEEAVIRSAAQNRFPKWSPDGECVAFTASGAGQKGLYKIPAAGGSPFRLSESSVNYAVWSRDGEVMYFILGRGQPDDIWRVHSDGSGERPVTDFAGKRGRLGREALATDGRYLYFTWEEDLGDIWVMDVENQ
jgi:TolB protein